MAVWEADGRFLVGLAGEITNNVIRGLQNVSQSFKISRFINYHKCTMDIPGSGLI